MASELFERVFTDAGTGRQICGFCGVTHWTRNFLDPEEIAEILVEAGKEPDKFIEHDWDAISWGILDNREFVPDCECDKTDQYETFIWIHRKRILEYLRERMEENRRQAQEELEWHGIPGEARRGGQVDLGEDPGL